jgi:hypothetical protein
MALRAALSIAVAAGLATVACPGSAAADRTTDRSRKAAPARPAAAKPAPGKRSGRVVRIERPRSGGGGTPRVCQLAYDASYPQTNQGMCWGQGVEEGEEAAVVDFTGVRGRIRVSAVTPPSCNSGSYSMWMFNFERIEGNLEALPSGVYNGNLFGLFDVPGQTGMLRGMDATQLRPPSSTGVEAGWVALDRDGDASEDFLVDYYQCDDAGAPVQASYGYGGNPSPHGLCMDYWARDGGSWRRLRQDIATTCNP